MIFDLMHRSGWPLFKRHVGALFWNTYVQFLLWGFVYGAICGSSTTWASKNENVRALQHAFAITTCMALLAAYARWLILYSMEDSLLPLTPLTRTLQFKRSLEWWATPLIVFFFLVPWWVFASSRSWQPVANGPPVPGFQPSLSYLLNLWLTMLLLLLVELYEKLGGSKAWTVVLFPFRILPRKLLWIILVVLFVLTALADNRFASLIGSFVAPFWSALDRVNEALLQVPVMGRLLAYLLAPGVGLYDFYGARAPASIVSQWSLTCVLALACVLFAGGVIRALRKADERDRTMQFDGLVENYRAYVMPYGAVAPRFDNTIEHPTANPGVADAQYTTSLPPEALCIRLGGGAMSELKKAAPFIGVIVVLMLLDRDKHSGTTLLGFAGVGIGAIRFITAFRRLSVSLGHRSPIIFPLRTTRVVIELIRYSLKRRLLEYLVPGALMLTLGTFSLAETLLALAALEGCYVFGALVSVLESYRTAGNWEQIWILVPVLVVCVPMTIISAIMMSGAKAHGGHLPYLLWIWVGVGVPLVVCSILLTRNLAARGTQLPGMTADARLQQAG